jgi:hypothetical protein
VSLRGRDFFQDCLDFLDSDKIIFGFMVEKLSKEKQELIRKLYEQKISIPSIAETAAVSYGTAWRYTRGKEKGYASSGEYMAHLALRKGFPSWNAQQESWVIKKGFESRNDYHKNLILNKGFGSMNDYLREMVKKRGFDSYHEYQKSLYRKGQKRKINQMFSIMIKEKLKELDKSQAWLARKIGITPSTVSRYVRRGYLPKPDTQELLFQVLKLPYSNLNDLLA